MYPDDNPRFVDDGLYGNDQISGDVVSFPASIQRRLDQAQALLRQGRASEALSALQQAGAELARSSPELFVLVVASQMGLRRITFEEHEANAHTLRTERYVLGVRCGHTESTTTDSKASRKSFRLD